MQINSPEFIGSTVLSLGSIIGLYTAFNRFKSSHNNSSPHNPPPPKLFKSPLLPKPDFSNPPISPTSFENLRSQVQSLQLSLSSEIIRVQQEFKSDYKELFDRYLSSFNQSLSLIHENAQQISTLIAQQQMTHQRVSELSLKTDKLYEKLLPLISLPSHKK